MWGNNQVVIRSRRLTLLLAFYCTFSAAAGATGRSDWSHKLDPFLSRIARGTTLTRANGEVLALAPGTRPLRRNLPHMMRSQVVDNRHWVFVHVGLRGGPSHYDGLARLIARLGGRVRGRVGNVWSIFVPASIVAELARSDTVEWMKGARRPRLMTEISTGPAHVDTDGVASTFGASGEGVILAVLDTGVDWTHPDFRNVDGSTRLLGIWDQTIVDPAHPPPPGFDFGAFYPRDAIDLALQTGPGLLTVDEHGHGTHVTGIAAGNGRDSGNGVPEGTFAGIATEAQLLAVKVFEGADPTFCDACDLVAGLEFVRQTSQAAGLPWVSNLSLGSNLGAHDGSDPTELAIDEAVGPGNPGAAVSISAGNSGWSARRFHWEGGLAEGVMLNNPFDIPSGTATAGPENDLVWLDIWYSGDDRITVTITGPDGSRIAAPHGGDSGIVCTPSGAVQVDATNAPDAANGDNQVFVQIWDSGDCKPFVESSPGAWSIEIVADLVTSPLSDFDVWMAGDYRGFNWINFDTFTLDESITVPGTARYGITVGSYVHKDQWINANQPPTTTGPCCSSTPVGTRSFFSSIGPTRDGRIKPDVAAPGEFVGSSLSAQDATPPSLNFRERDGRHHNMRGTSMAAPHVAGVAAVLLAIEPRLDAAEIAEVLRRTSRSDADTGAVPNNVFGHGKLHALSAAFEAAARVVNLSASETGFGARGHSQIPSYSVYRGDLDGLAAGDYGECLLSGLSTPSFDDPAVPDSGSGFFYLGAGVYNDPADGQPVIAGLGVDGSGRPRPSASPCP